MTTQTTRPRFTVHHPLTGNVLGIATTGLAVLGVLDRIAVEDGYVVLDEGGGVAECDPLVRTDNAEDLARYSAMRARWDAREVEVPVYPHLPTNRLLVMAEDGGGHQTFRLLWQGQIALPVEVLS